MAASANLRVETLFYNPTAVTRFYGYITPLGRELTTKATYTVVGDARKDMSDLELEALARDVANGYIAYFVNHRQIVNAAVDSAVAVVAGDAVYLATDDVRPAASITWNTNLATTQADFTNSFVGVAMTAKAAGAAGFVDVDISPNSVHLFTCASGTYEIGALMGMDKAAGDALLSSTLETAVAASSCFRVAQREATATTKVLVRPISSIIGHNAAAAQ